MSSSIAPARRRSRFVICLAVLVARRSRRPPRRSPPSTSGERTLHEGDRGHDVRVLQDFLTRAGFATPIAGVFGPETLQQRRALPARTPHGGRRRRRLRHRARAAQRRRRPRRRQAACRPRRRGRRRPSQHLGDRTLKKGMHGHDVRVLQDFLTRAGFPTPIAGALRPRDARATSRRFQRAHGLTPDGVVGPGTVQALRNLGDGGSAGDSGSPAPSAPVGHARLLSNGLAVAPADAPQAIKDVIAAGNRIATKPYVYGGGHGTLARQRLRLLGLGQLRAARRRAAEHAARLDELRVVGLVRPRPLDHGLRERRPRLHDRRRPALRHERREPVALAAGRCARPTATSCATRPASEASQLPLGGRPVPRAASGQPPAGTGVPVLAARLASAACPHSPIPTP